MNIRKINRALHRDLGYFFSGMIIIYALSGIALNHKHDWNPNYSVNIKTYHLPIHKEIKSEQAIQLLLTKTETSELYKKHYYPSNHEIKIFLHGGSVISYNSLTKKIILEELKKRPLFYSINFLHYNPGKLWKWFSDIFAISLILIVISGALILKGKNGLKKRGFILIILGILIPTLFFFIY